jgi:penicillin-binding protein 1A
MVELLKAPVAFGTARALRPAYGLYDIANIAGKTGTTNKNTDAWYIGFTPQLLAGVWVGCDDPLLRFLYTETGQGSRAAMPIWGLFMKKAYNDPKLKLKKDMKFFMPSDSSLVKNVCNEGEEYLIGGGDVGNMNNIDEENPDSEYGQ